MLDRRQFLLGTIASVASGSALALNPFGRPMTPTVAQPYTEGDLTVENFWQAPRRLILNHHETGEQLNAVYWANGRVDRQGYLTVCQFLRDFHENKSCLMDITVLNILRGIQGFYELNHHHPDLYVTSAFRTARTQRKLRESGLPAANVSRHEKGAAVDLYSRTVPASKLAKMGVHLNRGGVGYYPNRHFIHIDSGHTRHWQDFR